MSGQGSNAPVQSSRGSLPLKRLAALPAWVLGCFLAALSGAVCPPGEWYAQLHKPAWHPPDRLFGPVWTLLYIAMGISAWRVWCRGGFSGARVPLGFFLLQLLLNAAWTPVFFGLHAMGAAFGVIVLLWLMIAVTGILFFRHDRVAALLLVPYLAWVGFASVLNFVLWRLN